FAAAQAGWGLLGRRVATNSAPVLSPKTQLPTTHDAAERFVDGSHADRPSRPPTEPRVPSQAGAFPTTPQVTGAVAEMSERITPRTQQPQRDAPTLVPWKTWLAWAWLGLSLLLLVRLAGSAWAGRQLLAAARIVDDPVIRRAALMARERLRL